MNDFDLDQIRGMFDYAAAMFAMLPDEKIREAVLDPAQRQGLLIDVLRFDKTGEAFQAGADLFKKQSQRIRQAAIDAGVTLE